MACDGCASGEEKAQPQTLEKSEGASIDPPEIPSLGSMTAGARLRPRAEDLGPVDVSVLSYAGKVDVRNRYSSAVMVTTGDPKEGAQCSGVLIGSRLALTAASCVCRSKEAGPANESMQLINRTSCAERAFVMTVVYGTVHDPHTADMKVQAYAGTVRPHPGLELRFDAQSSVVTSRADLAVILLETPVESGTLHARLLDSEVETSEPFVTAGYGHDGAVEQIFGQRYFRGNKVTRASSPADERFSYAQQGVDVHAHHNGWSCFREDESGQWLVGVSSWASGGGASCVSTFFHRDWLRAEVQHAAATQEERQ